MLTTGVLTFTATPDPMDAFDIATLAFPHPVGWCVEQNIQHHWRQLLEHSFNGPVRSESVRYCINCGRTQRRSPEHTVPATPWADEK